jgi:type I restriction enzyme S subunit
MLGRMPVLLPPMSEQEKISAKVLGFKRMLQCEREKLHKLQSQKLGLMQDLLTGKVPVKIDEPATEPADA